MCKLTSQQCLQCCPHCGQNIAPNDCLFMQPADTLMAVLGAMQLCPGPFERLPYEYTCNQARRASDPNGMCVKCRAMVKIHK